MLQAHAGGHGSFTRSSSWRRMQLLIIALMRRRVPASVLAGRRLRLPHTLQRRGTQLKR